jgi:hypothetical protein
MTRFLADNPTKIWEGPSDPKWIQIGETTRSDNPEVSTPQVGSLGGILAHLKISRTSGI